MRTVALVEADFAHMVRRGGVLAVGCDGMHVVARLARQCHFQAFAQWPQHVRNACPILWCGVYVIAHRGEGVARQARQSLPVKPVRSSEISDLMQEQGVVDLILHRGDQC